MVQGYEEKRLFMFVILNQGWSLEKVLYPLNCEEKALRNVVLLKRGGLW